MRREWYPFTNVLRIEETLKVYDDFHGDVLGARFGVGIIPSLDSLTHNVVSIHRPIWTQLNGTPVSNGGFFKFLPGDIVNQRAECIMIAEAFDWTIRFQNVTAPNLGRFWFICVQENANNLVDIYNDIANDQIYFGINDGGVWDQSSVHAGALVDGEVHEFRLTYDAADTWNLYVDDVLRCTLAHAFRCEPIAMRIHNETDAEVWVSRIKTKI